MEACSARDTMDCRISKLRSTILIGLFAVFGLTPGSPTHASDDPGTSPAPPGLNGQPIQPAVTQPAQLTEIQVCGAADFAHEVVERVNIERFANGGLPPLKAVTSLFDATYAHSFNMAVRNFFAHCDLDTGKSPWQRMRDAGYAYSSAAENIATGQRSPAEVMGDWMNSYGHRANILGNFREIGVGYYYYAADTPDTRRDSNSDCTADGALNFSSYRYWTQDFGTRSNVYPVVINLESHSTDTRDVTLFIYGAGWADDMRLKNNDGPWTPWMAFESEVIWTLDPVGGTQSVTVEIRNRYGTVRAASDEICLVSDVVSDVIFQNGME